MLRYILKRLLWTIPVILGVTFIVYALLDMAPGDPATLVLSVDATEEQRDAWREENGLNDPFLVQFGRYCYRVVTEFDFGNSYTTKRSVGDEIAARLPKTMLVALLGVALGQLIGIPVGILSAVKQYSWQDNLFMVLALLGVSVPAFWSGLMLSILFALKLRWLPASGLYGPEYYILPTITLSLAGMGSTARMTRSCMLDVIRQDYITTARAKGVSERTVIFRHALKNALVPIITQTGMGVCALMGGAMITEIVFSIPGIGTYMVNSIKGMDYPCILGSVITVSICTSIILLIVDLAYAFVDPRIKAQYQSGRKAKKEAKKA